MSDVMYPIPVMNAIVKDIVSIKPDSTISVETQFIIRSTPTRKKYY